jgi:hypothetical protein
MMSVGDAIQTGHYCNEHSTKFFKNEKVDQNGDISVWFSHKKNDGSGFCVEREGRASTLSAVNDQKLSSSKSKDGILVKQSSPYHSMYVCNAMNNAVNLAANGAIGVDQIGQYFQKIYTELSKTTA